MDKANKTVIVTGGHSGLGFEAARAILRAGGGWHVIIAGRSPERCEAAATRLGPRVRQPKCRGDGAESRLAGVDPAIRR